MQNFPDFYFVCVMNDPSPSMLSLFQIKNILTGSGGGQVVSVLALYSDDPSSNPAEVNSFYSVNV